MPTGDARHDTNFWNIVFQFKSVDVARYPVLNTVVKALLSVFSGPFVEGSLNTMSATKLRLNKAMTSDYVRGFFQY